MKRWNWGKNGWEKTSSISLVRNFHNPNKKIQIPNLLNTSFRSKVSTSMIDEEIEGIYATTEETQRIQEANQEIIYGRAQEAMDKLPPKIQILLRDSTTWSLFGPHLFKRKDPILTAIDGNWGDDKEELVRSSNLTGEDISLATQQYLHQNNLFQEDITEDPLDEARRLTDITFNNIYVDIPIESIGSCNGTEFFSEEDIEDDYLSERRILQEFNPLLLKETEDKVDKLLSKYQAGQISCADARKEMELLVGAQLTGNINSNLCGFQYSSPQPSYERIYSDKGFDFSSKALERREKCISFITVILKAKNFQKLFGETGVFNFLSKKYQADKELKATWSEEVFKEQRDSFIIEKRNLGVDEETIRRAVWCAFDRTATKIPAKYKEDGILDRNSFSWRDSEWKLKKQKAFQELFLTIPQWQSIFKAKDIIKRRLLLTKNTKTKEEKEIIKEINKRFLDIRIPIDLLEFKKWLYDRKIKQDCSFSPAPIDLLTLEEEEALLRAISQCNIFIKQKTSFLRKISRKANLNNIFQIDFPEVSVDCFYPGCDKTIMEKPFFIPLDGYKGLLFVQCECGKLTPVISHEDLVQIISKQKSLEYQLLEEIIQNV